MPFANSEGEPIPARLNRWNWGAFLLNWIWGIGNSVWIALLCLIPLVNFIMMFVLGAKGSRWAWENRIWRDEEHFRRTQRNWAIAGVVVWLTVPLLIVGLVMSIFGALKSSDAYAMSMDAVRANPAVQAALGRNIETGFFVNGGIQLNGDEGNAHLRIPLTGELAEGAAYSRALKKAGQWELVLLVVRVEGRTDPIVIINKGNFGLPGGPLDT